MNRTDYIIKRNLSKLSTSKLYNLLQMNGCYDNKVVCLCFLFNEDMYYKFVESHLGAKKIIIIDNYIEQFEWIVSKFPFAKDKIQFVEYSDKIKFDNMPHFDVTIMNPPYNKNLHLKILENTIKNSNLVINISPVRWLQDPLATYKNSSDFKKFEYSISKHLKNVNVIDAKTASDCFNAAFYTNLAIYICDKNGGFDYMSFNKNNNGFISTLIEKIVKNYKCFSYNEDFTQEYKIILPATHGHALCKDWCEITSPNKTIAYNVKDSSSTNGYVKLSFQTSDERDNFYNSLFTNFYKYLIANIKTTAATAQYIKFIPLLPSYKTKWTNEMIYEYFELTNDEISQINEFIKNKGY